MGARLALWEPNIPTVRMDCLVFFFLSILKSCCEGEKGQGCTYLRDVAHGCLEISRQDLESRRKTQGVRP